MNFSIIICIIFLPYNAALENNCTEKTEEKVRCNLRDDHLLDWTEIRPECVKDYEARGWTEFLWQYDPEDDEDVVWADLPTFRREYLESLGWTESAYDGNDYSNVNPYELEWEHLTKKQRGALFVLGWNEGDWEKMMNLGGVMPYTTTQRADSKQWSELSEKERSAVQDLGFNETTWQLETVNVTFDPQYINLPIPALEKYNFSFFENLDVIVQLRDGSVVGDDEHTIRKKMLLSEYMKIFHEGTNLYLKYEDGEEFQKYLHDEIGAHVLESFFWALEERNLYNPEWIMNPQNEKNWFFMLGSPGTFTSLHNDLDVFNFLWVLKGKKRIVIIPYDEESIARYQCETFMKGHSCWPAVDVLHSDTLPPRAVEFEIGPGQGVVIPQLAWHAVINLEPTIAFGFRVQRWI